VTALALCKHNKNKMLLRHMSTHWRHDRVDEIFWDYHQVSKSQSSHNMESWMVRVSK